MVTYTGSATYWAPLKPRIRIYALSDTTYSSALYSYDPFTDSGTNSKPISLRFESLTSNAGSFNIEIEDKDGLLDLENLTKGCRVFIDCSKDGSTYQAAFKGLVRSYGQNLYATTGRNITINGYSYLIRLNERILSTLKESALIGGEGTDYDRTDSTMFTNNLVNNLLTDNTNYINMVDDTEAYSIFKTADITGSSITDWIPRLDVSLDTLGSALDNVLEFSNGLVMVDFSTDQLELFTPDRPSAATGFFLLTDQIDMNADDANITMYPLEPYKYEISYDYPNSGSRLIGSIGDVGGCPETTIEPPASIIDNFTTTDYTWHEEGGQLDRFIDARSFRLDGINTAVVKAFSFSVANLGNVSGHGDTCILQIINPTQNPDYACAVSGQIGTQVGSNINLYRNGVPGTPFPSTSTPIWTLAMDPTVDGPTITAGKLYWAVMDGSAVSTNSSNTIGWIYDTTTAGTVCTFASWNTGVPSWYTNYVWVPRMNVSSSTTLPACGGLPATKEADPVFAIAHDRNMSNRIGVVERALTDIPIHIKTAQAMHEYLFNKLYVAAKPRFTFDFPSVTMPNKAPKAGDIVTHVASRAQVGTKIGPIQTGVIDQVSYDFAQDSDGVLGLRKFGLSTTGIRKGYY